MKLTPEQVHMIFSLKRSGMTQKAIAAIVMCTQSAVSKILRRDKRADRPVHDTTADRYEYFLGDEAMNTGNLHNGHPTYSTEDPTFDEVALWERLENWNGGLD